METANEFNDIIKFLIKNDTITQAQANHAARVRSKLSKTVSMVEILKELQYVTEEQVLGVIQDNRLSMRTGSLLVELGYLDEQQVRTALKIQADQKNGKKIGEILIESHFVDERKFVEILSLHMGFSLIDLEFIKIDRSLFLLAPKNYYRKHKFIPVHMEKDNVLAVFADPMDKQDISAAEHIFGKKIIPAIAPAWSIEKTILRMEKTIQSKQPIHVSEDSIIGMVDSILIAAIDSQNVSDIHIEPMPDRMRVRFRRDGVLVHHRDFNANLILAVTSRIKVMCGADITEKRRHQGGRFFFQNKDDELDFRVSFYITIHGEKIVLRLLNHQAKLLDITEMGMTPKMLDRFINDALRQSSGVILSTGPTGSGKTTTIYSCINLINDSKTSIITAEEPVEYVIEGISQCSINPNIGLTFEDALRHIVRQDPDVIVIGEIRDHFSAKIAVEAALTGHKVLSTFHTEDSVGALIRLLDMNIEAFLISSTVVCVLAQRLLRKICPNCSQPYKLTPNDYRNLRTSPKDMMGANFRKGSGCVRCDYTGYKGRIAVFELLVLDEYVRDAVLSRKTSHELRQISIESAGLMTLLEDAIYKAAIGNTTVDELLRCVPRVQKPRAINQLRQMAGE